MIDIKNSADSPENLEEEVPLASPDVSNDVPAVESDREGTTDKPENDTAPSSIQEELEKLKDRHLRLQADFDNYRKRIARDDAVRARRATESLILDLLPVLDHFELGINAALDAKITPNICQGLTLVKTQFLDVLHKIGVREIETEGAEFDPNCHECVSCLPSPEVPADMIIEEIRRGYWLDDHLLRPARVVVSSGKPKKELDALATK